VGREGGWGSVELCLSGAQPPTIDIPTDSDSESTTWLKLSWQSNLKHGECHDVFVVVFAKLRPFMPPSYALLSARNRTSS